MARLQHRQLQHQRHQAHELLAEHLRQRLAEHLQQSQPAHVNKSLKPPPVLQSKKNLNNSYKIIR